MTFARVAGTVVSTVRSDSVANARFLLVELSNQAGSGGGEFLVALDSVGANRGEIVLLAQGSSCRWSQLTDDRPIDALIVSIVNTVDESGKVVYSADRGNA